MKTKTRHAIDPRPEMLKAAVKLAKQKGLFKFSRADIAADVECSEATVSYHVGTIPKLRTAVVQHAVEHEIMSILADALTGREKVGVVFSAALRKRIAAHIAS